MKTQKTNGKAGFSLCIVVASFLSHLLGKGWNEDRLIQAVESWYNDRKIVSDKVKYGSVTDKPKAGIVTAREQSSREYELTRSVVGQFTVWHDKIEGASDKLVKLGCQVTVTSLPEECQFNEWLHGFEVASAPKQSKAPKTPKAVKVPVMSVVTTPVTPTVNS